MLLSKGPAFEGYNIACRGMSSSTSNSSQMPKQTFVSTPIFYVNAKPHIGHLYTGLLADAYSRWCRMKGETVLFSTGTDEHGLKVQQAAESTGEPPSVFCKKISSKFAEAFSLFDVDYDDYIRTSEERHATCVHKFWNKIWENGHMYVGKHEGWYCTSDEVFLTESQVTTKVDESTGSEIKVSTESGHSVIWLSEENYMFRLSSFQEQLLDWLDNNPDVISPPSRYNEVKSFIVKNGLNDISVSRKRDVVNWAIPVPERSDVETSEKHSVYVWLDALTNYLTVTGFGVKWDVEESGRPSEFPAGASNNLASQSHGWPAACHIVGKDILKFHAIYWPSFLLAAGLPLPKKILAHGHWTVNRVKMSKSLGNVVDPLELYEMYGSDPVRYFLLRDGSLSSDGDFCVDNLELRRDVELADTLGNLLTRATGKAMLPKGLVLPTPSGLHEMTSEDIELRKRVEKMCLKVSENYDMYDFGSAIFEIMDVLRETNRYFQDMEPWTFRKRVKQALKKNESPCEYDLHRANTIIYHALETVRICGLLLKPIVPALSKDLLFYLNEDRISLEAIQGNIWREEKITFNGEYGQAFRLINKDPKK